MREFMTNLSTMGTFEEIWELICKFCKSQITEVAYKLWFSRVIPLELDIDNQTAVISAPNELHRQTLERCYKDLLNAAFNEIFGTYFTIKIKIPSDAEKISQKNKKLTLDSKYDFTFLTYVVGASNKFAHAACLAVAINPAEAYNPLFLHGNSGLGKTHLLHAICNDLKLNRPELSVLYIKGDDFTNELVDAIKKNTMRDFHEKYRKTDVILVDDVQFIAGKEATQEEFFHTFNTLYDAKKQIVLTSDRPPREIATLEERLRSRFEWGLIADIAPPDFETRVAIIDRKSELLNIKIPSEITMYVAKKLTSNIRQLEGAVKKLKSHMEFTGEPLTISNTNKIITDILNLEQPPENTVQKIIDEVAKTFEVENCDIVSPKRSGNLSIARQIAMYVAREITHMPLTDIGKEFGGRDHSTVVYAINHTEKQIKKNSYIKALTQDLIRNIRDR